jgi:hypothetical protein
MNWEEACHAADAAVFAKTGQHLTDVQMLILRGALAGQTYEAIAAASHYSVSYIKKFAGPSLWELLSQALGEPVSKTNFQTALVRASLQTESGAIAAPVVALPSQPRPPQMAGVPNTAVFFGRMQELTTLEQWIVQEQCRVVLLSGLGGIGKTTLIARFARQYHTVFQRIILLACNPTSTLSAVLSHLLRLLHPEAIALPDHLQTQQWQLLDVLQTERCLIMIDNVEDLLQGGELAGHYRQDCEALGEYLRQLTEADHQSCLVFLGRELPTELVAQAGDQLPLRHWRVKGLMAADAKQLLQAKGLDSRQNGIDELIQMKRGNPLALQLVATTIQELFGGNVAQLLKQSTVIIGDTLLESLNEQFERLSPVEKGVMYWLVLERQSLTRLKETTRFMVSSQSELIKALQSLQQRSLLEEDGSTQTPEVIFSLQPIVLRYTLSQFVSQISQDVGQVLATASLPDLGLLRTHLLFADDQFYPMRQSHSQFIEQSLLNQLQHHFGDRKNLHQHLHQILVKLHEKTNSAIGYATTNIVNLQRMIESQRL